MDLFSFLQQTWCYRTFVLNYAYLCCWRFIITVSLCHLLLKYMCAVIWSYWKPLGGKGWIYLQREMKWGENFQPWVQIGLGNDLLNGLFCPISKKKPHEQLLNVEWKSEGSFWWVISSPKWGSTHQQTIVLVWETMI